MDLDRECRNEQEELDRYWDKDNVLFEQSPCYITIQNRDLRLLRYNREFEKRFAPELGDYCFKAYKGRSERCMDCPVIRTFEDGQSHVSEEEGVDKHGTQSYWVVKTSAIKNEKGEVVAAVEMCLDLTRVKSLKKAVEKSEEKYKTIFNTIPNPVFILDAETLKILDCNDRVKTFYGFEKEELVNQLFLMLFDPNQKEDIVSKIKFAPYILREKQIQKSGNSFYASIRVASADYFGQRIIIVVTADITMRLMAEQQVIQAGKMAMLGEMATGVAHELNQPLTVIKTASSYLKRKVTQMEEIDGEILRTMAEEIDDHVDRASRIISHMREFGRKPEVVKERVQLNEVLLRAMDFFRQQLKRRGIEVVEDLDKALPFVFAESNRLEQVFINLLINARDAIEEKKRKEGIHQEAPERITLKTGLKEDRVTVEIMDTGIGIPEALHDKIFEPFYTTKHVDKGTGLGLSISYGIVTDYDGTIKVISEGGKGATFIIQFPAAGEG